MTINIHKKSAEFKVSSPKEIGLLIEILNGKIFLKTRQVQLDGWCKNYISKTQAILELKPHTFKPSLKDGWLAGLFDATGCVKMNVSTHSPNKSFSITQCLTMYQKDAEAEFKYLSKITNGKPIFFRAEGGKKMGCYYRVVVDYSGAGPIVEYFTRYKLYTIKAKSMEK